MRTPTALAIFLLIAAATPLAAETPFTFDLAPGTHGVGLRVVLRYDYSHTYCEMNAKNENARTHLAKLPEGAGK